MPHVLILGMTESGKTTFARELCHRYKARGIGTLVLDPLNDPRWGADLQTANVNEFLRAYWASRQCAVFIDEGAQSVGRYDDTMILTATQGRHWGHNNHYICQQPSLISNTVRAQCSQLALFTMNGDACKMLAKEFNKPELIDATNFPPGEYIYCGRYLPAERGNIFQERN